MQANKVNFSEFTRRHLAVITIFGEMFIMNGPIGTFYR